MCLKASQLLRVRNLQACSQLSQAAGGSAEQACEQPVVNTLGDRHEAATLCKER